MQVFKESLECPILRGGVIVSTENVKGVSGYIVDILEVHNKIKVTHVYIEIEGCPVSIFLLTVYICVLFGGNFVINI